MSILSVICRWVRTRWLLLFDEVAIEKKHTEFVFGFGYLYIDLIGIDDGISNACRHSNRTIQNSIARKHVEWFVFVHRFVLVFSLASSLTRSRLLARICAAVRPCVSVCMCFALYFSAFNV